MSEEKSRSEEEFENGRGEGETAMVAVDEEARTPRVRAATTLKLSVRRSDSAPRSKRAEGEFN